MSKKWSDIPKDWENVPVEAYKFMFSQAKDRYDEVMSESESITNKTITMTTITVAGLSGFVSFKYQIAPSIIGVVVLGLLYLSNLFCLSKLLFPKKIIQRGSPPIETFVDYLDAKDLSANEKIALIYYHELIRYQDRIISMGQRNSKRHIFYAIALCLTVINTAFTAGLIIGTIYHP